MIRIPPSGVAAELTADIPSPPGMDTLGGVRLVFSFDYLRPEDFTPRLRVGETEVPLEEVAVDPSSLTWAARFEEPMPGPVQVVVSVNDGPGLIEPVSVVSVYAWGAQTADGAGVLDPAAGESNPTYLTDLVEVGQVRVVTWGQWDEITGGAGS